MRVLFNYPRDLPFKFYIPHPLLVALRDQPGRATCIIGGTPRSGYLSVFATSLHCTGRSGCMAFRQTCPVRLTIRTPASSIFTRSYTVELPHLP